MSHEEPSAVGPEKASSVTFNFEKMEKTPLQQQRFHILRYLARNFSIILSKILIFFGENNCRNNIIIVLSIFISYILKSNLHTTLHLISGFCPQQKFPVKFLWKILMSANFEIGRSGPTLAKFVIFFFLHFKVRHFTIKLF